MERTRGFISGPLADIFGFGKNASTSPVVPGMAAGNMSGLQPTQADMSWYNKTMQNQAIDAIEKTLPPDQVGPFRTAIAQSDDPLATAKTFRPTVTSYEPPGAKELVEGPQVDPNIGAE